MNAFVYDQNLYSKIIQFLFVWIMFSITPVVVSCAFCPGLCIDMYSTDDKKKAVKFYITFFHLFFNTSFVFSQCFNARVNTCCFHGVEGAEPCQKKCTEVIFLL